MKHLLLAHEIYGILPLELWGHSSLANPQGL
jgi:hypothetical protein